MLDSISFAFTLSCAAFGSGVLSLPYALSHIGLIAGAAILMVLAAAIGSSVFVIMSSSRKNSANSYSQLMDLKFPGKPFGKIVDILICMNGFGACVSYMVMLGGVLPHFTEWLGLPSLFQNRTFVLVLVAIFLLPFTCLKNYSSLKAISYVPILGLLISTCLIVARWFEDRAIDADIKIDNFAFSASSFGAFNVFLFAFMQHAVIVQIATEMKGGVKTIAQTCFIASFVQGLVYCSIAVSGYLQFGSLTRDNILLNYPIQDPAMQFCRISVSANMMMSMILNIMANNQSIIRALGPLLKKSCVEGNNLEVPLLLTEDNQGLSETGMLYSPPEDASQSQERIEKYVRIGLSSTTVLICLCLGIVIEHAAAVLALLGGLCCAGLMCGGPALLLLVDAPESKSPKLQTAGGVVMALFGSLGLFGIFFTFHL